MKPPTTPTSRNASTNAILDWRPINQWQLECRLDLGRLFETGRERENFERKYLDFYDSDPSHPQLFRREGEHLIYLSEQLIPKKPDPRPPVLLVLGNPASHSVKAGLFFSYQGDGREHKFWNEILRPAGLDLAMDTGDVAERNRQRRQRLLELDYPSPFRIGLAVFISMPSGPGPGVRGIESLLGRRPFEQLKVEEQRRVVESSREFFAAGGTAVAFQSDAWNGLRRPADPAYSLELAQAGGLVGGLRDFPDVKLFGIPPTRIASVCRTALKKILLPV